MSVAQEVNERLAALTAQGTSVWLDQIRRSLIEGGELQRLIDEYSLRGVTSNPSIFEKAILGSDDYDDELVEMARQGLGPQAIYENIAIRDVQMAADVLRPLYDELDGKDGYVSLEVMPDLAHDADATIAQAREYWRRVDRPNVMIKIPGTDEGLSAIEQAIFEGINVNVTLLFSVEAYEKVAGRVHPRARAAQGRRRVARRALGRELLRLARGLGGRQAARAARPHRSRREGRDRERPGRVRAASRRSSAASASPSSSRPARRCSGRCGPPRA